MNSIKTTHALPNSTILNTDELKVIEDALLNYGRFHDVTDEEKKAIRNSLKKLSGIQKAACCNAIRIEPI